MPYYLAWRPRFDYSPWQVQPRVGEDKRIRGRLFFCVWKLDWARSLNSHLPLLRFARAHTLPHDCPISDDCVFQTRDQAATAISPTLIRLSTLRTPSAFHAARSASSRSNSE